MRSATRNTVTLLASAFLVVAVAAPAHAAVSPTELVADIRVGAMGSDPADTIVFNDKLYFSANDGAGQDLFVSDGSIGSAVNLNVNPTGGSNPGNFVVDGSSLYFTATDGVHGRELWVISGSAAPAMVVDIEAGSGGGNPRFKTVFKGDLYFTAFTSGSGQTLWKLSGGVATQYAANLSDPDDYIEYNGFLYFAATGPSNTQLYRIDGINPPTLVAIVNPVGIGNPSRFAIAGGALYFIANDAPIGGVNYELWTTDGTVTTQLTTDLAAANGYQYFGVYNDTLYFSAGNAAIGRELGITRAGAAPTYVDINPGAAGSDPEGFTTFNGSMYFNANNGVNGDELYSVTGTGAPTLRADIAPGPTSGYAYDFTVVGNKLAFAAAGDGVSFELWSFDGVTANQESAINPTGDANAFGFVVLGDYVYYQATSAATGRELYRTLIGSAAAAVSPAALAATGTESLIPVGVAGAMVLAGLALALTRRRALKTQE